ncbi:MAG TPA: Flp pilus assembly protein CpaB [Chloroflexota bacterium]|nr:Flp pilus assembly protein CpaB [Chloroflexota bacterium]
MQVTATRRTIGASLPTTAGGRKALLIALTLGLIAAMLSWQYVRGAGQGARQGGLVPVVVAAADIAVRTEVTPQMLAIKQVPADARHEKALTSLEQVTGKVTSLPIAAGEQVLGTKFFARKEDSGLAFRVPPGKRAISVNVSEVVTSGGLVVPGDFVDVVSHFASGTFGQGEAGEDIATVILQNIEVLAVDQSIQGPGEASSGVAANIPGGSRPDAKQEAVARPNARTATLAVTPEDAQKLILAEARGKIRLALRGVADHETASVPGTRLSSFRR